MPLKESEIKVFKELGDPENWSPVIKRIADRSGIHQLTVRNIIDRNKDIIKININFKTPQDMIDEVEDAS